MRINNHQILGREEVVEVEAGAREPKIPMGKVEATGRRMQTQMETMRRRSLKSKSARNQLSLPSRSPCWNKLLA